MTITQTLTFQKAVSTLTALQAQGVKFRILAGDESFGDLETVTHINRKRRIRSRAHGSIAASFKPKLIDMNIGDLVVLETPVMPDLTPSHYSSCISAWCSTHWGKGNYLLNRSGTSIEVLRVK